MMPDSLSLPAPAAGGRTGRARARLCGFQRFKRRRRFTGLPPEPVLGIFIQRRRSESAPPRRRRRRRLSARRLHHPTRPRRRPPWARRQEPPHLHRSIDASLIHLHYFASLLWLPPRLTCSSPHPLSPPHCSNTATPPAVNVCCCWSPRSPCDYWCEGYEEKQGCGCSPGARQFASPAWSPSRWPCDSARLQSEVAAAGRRIRRSWDVQRRRRGRFAAAAAIVRVCCASCIPHQVRTGPALLPPMAVLVHARRKRLLLSGEIRLLSGIHMYKGMPALLSRQVKVTTLGYDWRKIQRKKLSGLKRIFIHRQPNSRRYKNKCKNCRDQVASKCDYCCPSCKIVHKPTGNNADLLQDLINIDFNEEAVRDFFCLGCLRAFASTHCANHNLHIHGDEEEAVLVEIREHHGWQLIPEDVIGQPVLLERIKRILVDGVPMVAVCRRQVPDYWGANRCANLSCRESVDR